MSSEAAGAEEEAEERGDARQAVHGGRRLP